MNINKVLKYIKNDKVRKFELCFYKTENINNFEPNILLLSCSSGSWKIVEYIISVCSVELLNDIDENNATALMYAFLNDKYDIATMLLDFGFTNFSQRSKQGNIALQMINDIDKITHNILERILNPINIKKEQKIFKMYEPSELNLKNIGKSGGYGNIFYDESGKNIVKVTNGEKSKSTFIRELILLRMINKINPTLCLQINGFAINDMGEYMLILEDLHHSLADIFDLYSKININSKRNYFLAIYRSLISSVDKLHNIGIIHRDLKPDNIMVDVNGHIRIIDLGLANFVGVKGIINTKREFSGTNAYIPPDSNVTNSLYNNYDKYLISSNNRNYSSDIFSIGVIIMNSITHRNLALYFSNDEIFTYEHNIYHTRINMIKITEEIKYNIECVSPHLMDLLKHMFNTNSLIRYTAKDVLNHKIFNENIPNILNLDINRPISKIEPSLFTLDDIRFQRGEIRYGKEIYNFYLDCNIPKCKDVDNVKFMKYDNLNKKYDFDIIFNTNIILSSFETDTQKLMEILYSKVSSIEVISYKNFYSFIETNIVNYTPISIVSVIEYYVLMLQYEDYCSSTIELFKQCAYDKIYRFSISQRDEDVTVERLLKSLILDISDTKDIIMPFF